MDENPYEAPSAEKSKPRVESVWIGVLRRIADRLLLVFVVVMAVLGILAGIFAVLFSRAMSH